MIRTCALCGVPTESFLWVRPVTGGRRTAVFACDASCKGSKLESLAREGLREANDVLGWDVFIPMWERET